MTREESCSFMLAPKRGIEGYCHGLILRCITQQAFLSLLWTYGQRGESTDYDCWEGYVMIFHGICPTLLFNQIMSHLICLINLKDKISTSVHSCVPA